MAVVDGNTYQDEYPPAADLREMMAKHPLPVVPRESVPEEAMTGNEPTKEAVVVLRKLNAALASNDAHSLASCFLPSQAYWKDSLALTWHLRTFASPGVIAASLLQTKTLRQLDGEIKVQGDAQFMPATPVLRFIDCTLAFKTKSPAAICSGRMLLLPAKQEGTTEWKIWILSTWLESLDGHPEDETLLQSRGRELNGLDDFETDVFIIGGGNAAVALAARLKVMGVDSVMAERNRQPGDNWALRYDCLRFHVPTEYADLPYMPYDKKLRGPHLLTRDELAEQVRRYVKTFNLNMITSAKILSTTFDQAARQWVVKFQTPAGQHTAISRHLVQATGIGSRKPYIPPMSNEGLFKGISIHSTQYRNAVELQKEGAKSVLVVGSASTAFDVIEDCHTAGLQTTMVVRSRTYIVPIEYICDKRALGAYDQGTELGDKLFMTLPTWVDAQLACGLFAQMAAEQPDRYSALAAAGFPFIDSRHPEGVLTHHLLERAGGHYVDIGGTKLIAEQKVGLKAGVEPVAYTETGLQFSDGSTADADAVVWCTGFADKDARRTAAEILGGESAGTRDEVGSNVLGPSDLAARLSATWGVDAEGEIHGMWKRHLRVDSYWIMGGHTQQHRWFSRILALQIKADLEGILPPAYRDTPGRMD
ncbi:putative indole-3-pyruvate monooxygenase YUCCA4 [Achaetomium macrosporum]|uniref:Indole-3-pyruvate monooxygenase YUCCA4 n=1 Tax=Achaetomium macrosporum TaxID=79813 RepID=A0AAN7CBN7_9PEZI|nr:putative indole-3-pyruvate monooxygenase YUCCA4 [Achaetomium macrosporum]